MLCYLLGGAAGVLTALTNQPLAWKRVVPFHVHGQVDTPFVPTLLLLPWATGALKQRNARRFFASFTAVVLANYLLTDYDASEYPEARNAAMAAAAPLTFRSLC